MHVSQGLPQCLPPRHWGSSGLEGDLMDFVATRTGDRTTVRHADRWTITHTAGDALAHVGSPTGELADTVQVLMPATVESLSAALHEYADGAEPPGGQGRVPY